MSLRDKFDSNPNNEDWRDELLLIVGLLLVLTFLSVIALLGMKNQLETIALLGLIAGNLLISAGLYIRLMGKKDRG